MLNVHKSEFFFSIKSGTNQFLKKVYFKNWLNLLHIETKKPHHFQKTLLHFNPYYSPIHIMWVILA